MPRIAAATMSRGPQLEAEGRQKGCPLRKADRRQSVHRPPLAPLGRHLLERGIYVAPSQFEAMFVSLAHTDADVDRTVEAVGDFHR